MPQAATISVADDSVGGTNMRDFVPVMVSGGVAKYENADATTASGRPIFTYTFDPRKANRATDKIVGKLTLPKEVLQDGVYNVVATALGTFEFRLPDILEQTDIDKFAHMMGNLVTHTIIQGSVKDLEAVY